MKLLIVESPAKVKKIKGFLGEGWQVEASMGHVRDLPDKELGITIADGFKPSYVTLKGKEAAVKRLMKAIKAAEAVYLATDPDREGEAISWHILELAHLPKSKPVHRVTFTAITKAAVQAAVAAPRALDMNLVEAQQARRVVDRLVGWMASALVCRALDSKYSAGRVQSVALRLIVDREREVQAFTPRQYWSVGAKLKTLGGVFDSKLTLVNGKKVEELNKEQAEGLTAKLAGAVFWVGKAERGEKNRRPSPPFTTSSLQQAASKALGLSPDKTMELAQVLYEAGIITYMRTDAVSVAPEGVEAARAFIQANYGTQYVPAQPQTYTAKMDNAQEAHEAIRPVDVAKLPEQISTSSDGIGVKLYALIRDRFLASQMADARYAQTSASILLGKTLGQPYPIEFAAQGRSLLFDGFLRVYREALDDGEEAEDEGALPVLSDGQALEFVEWLKKEHTTKAPSRYTEASLVQALEREGIGRPSTFASMVKLVKDKGYAKLEKKRLVPTEGGLALSDFLVKHFPKVVDYAYTATLEKELDAIASGKASRLDVVMRFWGEFDPALKAVGTMVKEAVTQRSQPKPTGEKCPKCGGALVERRSKNGPFVGCSNYPTCKFSMAAGRYLGKKSAA